MHQSYLFVLLFSLISWQYLGLVETQPSFCLHFLIVDKDTFCNSGHFCANISLSLYVVSSSFSVNVVSINIVWTVFNLLLCRLRGRSHTDLVMANFFTNRCSDLKCIVWNVELKLTWNITSSWFCILLRLIFLE